jgi:hypothetical protein
MTAARSPERRFPSFRVDVLDHADQCPLANWLDDPLPRTGVAVSRLNSAACEG